MDATMRPRRRVNQAEAELEAAMRQVDRVLAEAMTTPGDTPDPRVERICREAHAIATQTRRDLADARRAGASPAVVRAIQVRAQRWLANTVRSVSRHIGTLHRCDVDRYNGCLTRVTSALGAEPRRMRPVRRAVARRLGIPQS
jgi:hypothetical protein